MKSAFIVATALAAALALPASGVAQEDGEKCYGVAKAGMNDCEAGGHDCAGQSKADQDKESFVLLPEGTFRKIDGGSLEPQA